MKHSTTQGTPDARFYLLLSELEKRFPISSEMKVKPSFIPEIYFLSQIDNLLKQDSVK